MSSALIASAVQSGHTALEAVMPRSASILDIRHVDLPATDSAEACPSGVFYGVEIVVLTIAYQEALAFLGPGIGLAKRLEIASTILNDARKDVRNAHRLAIKAIVAV
jgi:hypothetical protein